jgi:hypothetical protein
LIKKIGKAFETKALAPPDEMFAIEGLRVSCQLVRREQAL